MLLSTRKFSMGITAAPPPGPGEGGRRKREGRLFPSTFLLPSSSPPSFALLAAGQDDRADERHQQHQRGDLERRRPVEEQRLAQVAERLQGYLVRFTRPLGGDGGEDREPPEGGRRQRRARPLRRAPGPG